MRKAEIPAVGEDLPSSIPPPPPPGTICNQIEAMSTNGSYLPPPPINFAPPGSLDLFYKAWLIFANLRKIYFDIH